MGVIRDRFAGLNVRTVSDDGSVAATMKQAGGLRLEIEPGMRDRHTEQSLALAIENVLVAAVRGYNKGVRMICEQVPAESAAADPNTPSGKRRLAYLNKIENIDAGAESPKGFVDVNWDGADAIRIELDGSPHTRLSEQALEAEVNAALGSVIRIRNAKILKGHEEVYQFHRYGMRTINDARK